MRFGRTGAAALAAALAIAISPTLASAAGNAMQVGGGDAPKPVFGDADGIDDLSGRKQPSLLRLDDPADVPTSPRADVAPRGAIYRAGSVEELRRAVESIAASPDKEATLQLTASISSEQGEADRFAGIAGKTVMVSSDGDNVFSLAMASDMVGGIVLDNVTARFAGSTVFLNANDFETTDRFAGAIGVLYGGGAKGADAAGDVKIVLRGGRVSQLFGGGLDSNLDGSVHIVIDAPTEPGALPAQTVGGIHGGGRARQTDQGRVTGDVTIDFLSGSNGELFGGGLNEFDQDASIEANPAAMVAGTVTVNLGYEGAPARSVWPGTAMFSFAGSVYSTVGNVRLNILEGCSGESSVGDRDFYACGYNDTVLGTVEVNVDGFDANASFVRFGGDVVPGEYYAKGHVRILNREGCPNAVTVRWNTPMEGLDGYAWCGVQGSNNDVPTTINGDVLVEIESGYLAFVKLDSEDGGTVIDGDSTVRVRGAAKIAQVEGNELERDSEEGAHRTTAELIGADATIGYLYNFDEVRVTDGAKVLVDGGTSVFPMFDSTQKPFYSTLDLRVDSGAHLTTRDSATRLQRSVAMEGGAWHAKGFVYVGETVDTLRSSVLWDTYSVVGENHKGEGVVPSTAWTSEGDTVVIGDNAYLNQVYGAVEVKGGTWSLLNSMKVVGDFRADGMTLQLPVIAEGSNYPSTWIPLAIEGVASGRADVVTVSRDNVSVPMDASAWAAKAVVPALGENYITSSAPGGVGDGAGQDLPTQATFTLAKGVQGPAPYYLKRLPDADEARVDSHYMWQVAKGEPVEPELPGPGGQDDQRPPATPGGDRVPAVPGSGAANSGHALPTTGDALSIPLVAGLVVTGIAVVGLGAFLRSRGKGE